MRFALQHIVVALMLFGSFAVAGDLTLDAAVAQVSENRNDRIVRATEETGLDGRTVYRLRLVNQSGRMYTLEVDAESGEMREVATGPLVIPRGAPPPVESTAPEPITQAQDPCAS